MSFNVFPLGTRPAPEGGSARDQDAANVVSLESRRKPSPETPAIPDEVWDQVDAAALLWEELSDAGREIRFAQLEGGRVVATLRELGGGDAVRALPLQQLLGPDGDGPLTAA